MVLGKLCKINSDRNLIYAIINVKKIVSMIITSTNKINGNAQSKKYRTKRELLMS